MNLLIIKKEIIFPIEIVALTAVLYLIFRMFVNVGYKINFSKKSVKASLASKRTDNIIYSKRILAFLIYGVIPIIVVKYIFHERLQDYGFAVVHKNINPIFFFMMTAILFPIMILLSKKKKINSYYPEVKRAHLSKTSFLLSTITYILYYFGYESLYRGFLVFGLRRYTGDFIAVIASMVFTSITHLSSPLIVLIGSIVSGIVFPYIVILSGSIWALFVFHSLIGISMDIFCIRAKRSGVVLDFNKKVEIRKN